MLNAFNKKNLRRMDLAVSLVLGPLLLNEVTGYALLELPGGINPACAIDPTCHRLSEEQIAVARNVFGDQIDYSKVRFFTRPAYFFSRGVVASSKFGSIYVDKGHLPQTQLETDDTDAYVYVHEMTHVWQYQGQPLSAYFAQVMGPNGYKYNIDDHKNFHDFGVEQQAEIIGNEYFQRYVLARAENFSKKYSAELEEPVTVGMVIRGACGKLEKSAEKVQQAFPALTLPAQCAALRPR